MDCQKEMGPTGRGQSAKKDAGTVATSDKRITGVDFQLRSIAKSSLRFSRLWG